MLRLTKHAHERSMNRTLLTEEDLNILYSNDLTVPIGTDSVADHLLIWSIKDQSAFVLLVPKNSLDNERPIITLMDEIYHQNQNRFRFDISVRNELKEKTEKFFENPDTKIMYKYRFANNVGDVIYRNDSCDSSKFCYESFKTEKLKDLIDHGYTIFDLFKLRKAPINLDPIRIIELFKKAVNELGGRS